MPDLTEAEWEANDFGSYPVESFYDDMARVTESRCDPDLTETLISGSLPTAEWLRAKGVRFVPMYHSQAFNVDGRFRFWGGLTVEAVGGGLGLVNALSARDPDEWISHPGRRFGGGVRGEAGPQGTAGRECHETLIN